MKIAQVAPLIESVPPRLYGGTERIVSYLTEELVRLGHEVVLFASGDSVTSAELVACSPESLRLDPTVHDPLLHHVLLVEQVRQRAREFDIIHFHIDYLHFPLERAIGRPAVSTLHGRLDLPDYPTLFAEFGDMPVVSISQAQRQQIKANWVANVYHGLPRTLYRFEPGGKDGYLAFLGRMSREKRPDRAIEIARRAGLRLKIAAKVGEGDRAYFDKEVRPLLDQPHVEFLGEISEAQKQAFLGGARALLFPIDWPEPFGLVMIEAMACGTPVVAWRCGSVPEVVDEGVTGFVVDRLDEAVSAVGRIGSIDRQRARSRFEERFTAERMARDYLKVYEALIDPASADAPLAGRPLARLVSLQAA